MKKTFMSWLGAAAVVAFILIPVTAAEQTRKEKEVLDVLEEPAVTEIITEAAIETTTTVVTTTVVTTTTSEVLEEETEGEEIEEEESYESGDDYSENYEDYDYDNEDVDTSSNSYEASYSGGGDREVSDYEYNLLVNLTSSEYGANWVSTEEKSKIAATVLNIADEYYGGNITDAIYNSCVPYGFDPSYDYYKDESIYNAVDNVLNNESDWDNWGATQWTGDGQFNYFT